MDDPNEWLRRAACKAYPLPKYKEYWFPDDKRKMPREARRICRSCPVLKNCEAEIMRREGLTQTTMRMGNWARMTPFERKNLALRRFKESIDAENAEPKEVLCACGCNTTFFQKVQSDGSPLEADDIYASVACMRREKRRRAISVPG